MLVRTISLLAGLAGLGCSIAEAQVVPRTQSTNDEYIPAETVTGELVVVASESMQQMALLWTTSFRRFHPEVTARVEPHSNQINANEVDLQPNLIRLVGYSTGEPPFGSVNSELKCLEALVGYDMLAIIMSPIHSPAPLVWDEAAKFKLFENEGQLATTWGELGDKSSLADQSLVIHLQADNGDKSQFLKQMFPVEDSKQSGFVRHSSHRDLMKAVAKDPGAVAFYSVSRGEPSELKCLPITVAERVLDPFSESAVEDGYPLLRPLVASVPSTGLWRSATVDEFLKYILSREGQLELVKDGYFPLGSEQKHRQEIKLGWEILK